MSLFEKGSDFYDLRGQWKELIGEHKKAISVMGESIRESHNLHEIDGLEVAGAVAGVALVVATGAHMGAFHTVDVAHAAPISIENINNNLSSSIAEAPIYVWNSDKTVLLDIRYRKGVGYNYPEIEKAFIAFATTACDGPNEAKCWHGNHVGILKNIYTQDVSGFYKAPNGRQYLIDVGECRVEDGCQP